MEISESRDTELLSNVISHCCWFSVCHDCFMMHGCNIPPCPCMQILRVLITILDTSNDPRSLAVTCFDLSQFIQYHPSGRIIVNDLKAKERVMKLMNHENAEVTKNALLCIQRLFLGAKYASFLQA